MIAYILLAVFLFSFLYLTIIRPYKLILYIKNQLEKNGYTVLVTHLNFFKDVVGTDILQNQSIHKDSLHHLKTDFQGYDVTISNCFIYPYVLFNSPETLKQAYKKIQCFSQVELLKSSYARLYGGGIIMSEGKVWKAKRKLYSEIFNFNLLQELHPVIQKSIEESMEKWKTNQSIDLLQKFKDMLFSSFIISYFGKDFDDFKFKDETFSESLAKLFQDFMKQSFSLRHVLFGTSFLQKGYLSEDKSINERINAVKVQTKEFMKKRFDEIKESNNSKERSIMSKIVFKEQIINLQGDQEQVMLQSIIGDLMIFFFAAIDTTSSTLIATLHMLHQHPQVLKKLKKQLSQNQIKYSSQDLKSLQYMDAVFNETLRLYGPGNYIFPRSAPDGKLSILDVQFPKQTIFGVQSITAHYSQKYYPKANVFSPERWMENKTEDPFSFVAFGGGQRNCIGQYLAKIEYKITLAKFLTKYEFNTKQQFVMHSPMVYVSKNNNFTLTNAPTPK